jgi:hypothetical protein
MKMNRGNEFNDSLLEADGQKLIQRLVAEVPDDELSLAWRSSLNEQLIQVAAVKHKKRSSWLLKPAFGLAFAGALAAVVMIRTAPVNTPSVESSGTLEAALVRDHQQSMIVSDVVGIGLNPLESRPTDVPPLDEWSEVDLESL